MTPLTLKDRAQGVLVGAAAGDALGSAVEFMNWTQMGTVYGARGIQGYDIAYGGLGRFTDDTQQLLFMTDGLIRARMAGEDPLKWLRDSGQRWLATQGDRADEAAIASDAVGWLFGLPELHSRRSPDAASLAGFRNSTVYPARNSSRSPGTLVRCAAVGLFDIDAEYARSCSFLSHGSDETAKAAHDLAGLVRWLMLGHNMLEFQELSAVWELAQSDRYGPDCILEIGDGSTAQSALEIGAFCAARSSTYSACIRLAVNHPGKSDTTGAVAGLIFGAALGIDAIEEEWLDDLELADVLLQMGEDVSLVEAREIKDLKGRYPVNP